MEERNYLKDYYESVCDEDGRLNKNSAQTIEFITTNKYIEKYLKKGDRILEIGTGTGAYSLYYANKGYKVDAIELIQHNVDRFKANIKPEMDVNVIQGNALDLSEYRDNQFDITLVLGPLYHLYTEEDKKQAINEAIRVTKEEGHVFIAYLTHGSLMLNYALKKGKLSRIPEICDDEYRIKDMPEELFTFFYIDEFEKLMSEFNCEYIGNIATDGIAPAFKEILNGLSEEEFTIWLDYHLCTCERKDIQGYSSHMLYVAKKTNKY